MSFRESLHAMRRWLLLIVFAVVAGVGVGWFWGFQKPSATVYQATGILMLQPQPAGATARYDLDQLAVLATMGSVPTEVARILHMPRQQVRSMVSASTLDTSSVILVTGRSTDPAQAASLADVTGKQLIAYVAADQRATYDREVEQDTARVQAAGTQLSEARAGAPVRGLPQAVQRATQQLSIVQQELATAQLALQSYLSSPRPSPLVTLETAVATPAPTPGNHVVTTRLARAALLGGFGLLFGVAAVIGLERIDKRVFSKRQAEETFGYPVLAEVPPMPQGAGRQLLTETVPASHFVEAYRALRSMVSLWALDQDGDGGVRDGGRVILVTSAVAEEGKTTTVAHLGALLGESGHSVLLVSADLRRPQLHTYFGRCAEPGLVDVLRDGPGGPDLTDLDLTTSVRGVSLISSGAPVNDPGRLLERAGWVLSVARRLYDFVLVDAPPLLVVNDASDLARHVDGVLLVAYAGRTPHGASRRAAELLDQLQVPVLGTVLLGVSASGSSAYYRSHYRYGRGYGDGNVGRIHRKSGRVRVP